MPLINMVHIMNNCPQPYICDDVYDREMYIHEERQSNMPGYKDVAPIRMSVEASAARKVENAFTGYVQANENDTNLSRNG